MPDGVAGISATLDEMVKLTKQYRTDLTLRDLAESLVASVPSRSYWGEAQAVQDWVRNNIRYTADIADVETLKTPLELFVNRFGDCDDMSMMAGTLLQTIGHPVRYVAVATSGTAYDHVYPETKIGNRWVAVETTEPVPLGWVPPEQYLPPMIRHV